MKKLLTILLIVFVLFSCQEEKTPDLMEQLTDNPSGWDLASITHESNSNYDYVEHYTNVGTFVFYKDNTGEYTYGEQTTAFKFLIISNEVILLKFDFDRIMDYSSPFLFYAVYHRQNYDNYGAGWEDAFEFNVNILTDYSIRMWDYTQDVELFLLKVE
jgi:hypothetical protein